MTSARMFWTYWAASTTSSVGSAISAVALPLIAITVLDVSALEVGVLAASGYAAWLVIGLPAGVIAQRLPLRGTQVALDLLRALAVLSIPLAWWFDTLVLVHLVAVALVISFANVLFDVSNSTFLPRIVPREDLQARNSLTSGTHAVTQLGGPSLGGLLVQLLGAVPTLVVDAVSYLASAILLRTLPASRVERPDVWPPMRAMIREGFGYVARHPVMGPCMWNATAINFVCGAQLTLFPLYLVRELGLPAGAVGVLIATEGIGALVGATLTTRLATRFGTARLDLGGNVLVVVGAMLIPLGVGASAIALFAVGNVVFAGGVVVGSIATRTYRQTASPPHLLSRVMATVRFVSWGAIPVGSLLAGVLAGVTDSRTALLVLAAVSVLAPLTLWCSRVRTLRDFTDYDDDRVRTADTDASARR
ncbi:MAG: MFS transporter [Nocardioides sp.]|uniref:MFS transporter n=1 Tax=Nocardioides sp. TaxID=35761 RepID=UPI0023A72C28|nr:MFS transporter [Nocardioides sp.]MDE0776667.1 MFS transporter [Nocardioides sp.]